MKTGQQDRTRWPGLVRGGALAALLFVCLPLLQVASAAGPEQGEDPTVAWGQLIGALNAADAGAAAGVFSLDGVYQQVGSLCDTPCMGRDAILPQLQQIVATRPVLTTLPGVSIADGMVSGRLQIVPRAAPPLILPFEMAVDGTQIVALRFAAPEQVRIMSAGTGGLIRVAGLSEHTPALLGLLGVALGLTALVLLRMSRTPDPRLEPAAERAATRPTRSAGGRTTTTGGAIVGPAVPETLGVPRAPPLQAAITCFAALGTNNLYTRRTSLEDSIPGGSAR